MESKLLLVGFICFISFNCFSQVDTKFDTVYVNDKNPVMLIFENKYKGQIGNDDYSIVDENNTLKIAAKSSSSHLTYIEISVKEGEQIIDQIFLFVKYKRELPRLLYDYRKNRERIQIERVNKSSLERHIDVNTEGVLDQVDQVDTLSFQDMVDEVLKRKSSILLDGVELEKQTFGVYGLYVYEGYLILDMLFKNEASLKYDMKFIDIFRCRRDGVFKKLADEGRRRLDILYSSKIVLPVVKKGEQVRFVLVTEAVVSNGKESLFFKLNDVSKERTLEFFISSKKVLNAKLL